MIINFVGNFQAGYVGEVADETHLAREIEVLGHTVRRIPRDEWREHIIDGKDYKNVPKDLKADINIVAKWHHFYDRRFIDALKERSNAPAFLWVWDYMYDQGFPDWHIENCKAADLYLTNEYGIKRWYEDKGVDNVYYFPFDVADENMPPIFKAEKKYDVAFFGSWLGQGDRIKYLEALKDYIPLKIFSWNHQEFTKRGFDAEPAVYGEEFNKKVAETKICLGFSVSPHCWGYWSNRVGKTLLAGGFLLYQYAPGMELFLRDGAEYFNSPEELREKIDHYIIADTEREAIATRGYHIARDRFSSKARVKELMILVERYLKTKGIGWSY